MVGRMLRNSTAVALGVFASLLGACGGGVRARGSTAIASFLASAQRNDPKAFEAALDRASLRSDLSEQLADVGKSHEVDVGGPSEFALDRMINPQAVRLTAARVAPGWPPAPTPAQIVPHMKAPDRRHVCLEEASTKRCLLSFAEQNGAWRLVGMAFTPPPSDGPPAAPAPPSASVAP